MIIKTESGSEYYLRNGILNKKNDNMLAYKVIKTIPFPNDAKSIEEINEYPAGKPEVGKRLYISGLGSWNVTTTVVEVLEEE